MNQFFRFAVAEYNEVVKRWAWNIFCLLSLLVFVGSVTLWVRSYFAGNATKWWIRGPTDTSGQVYEGRYGFGWARGGIYFICNRHVRLGSSVATPDHRNIRGVIAPTSRQVLLDWSLGSFQAQRILETFPDGWISRQQLVLPLWLFLPAAIPPLVWLRGWRKSRRRGFAVVQMEMGKDEKRTMTQLP